ncbi:MAG: enoyl-CoA hydratase/isomerase family protein [Gammaproteobacteria bacterium]|nr:enoyl-CoA hydratase/isomerase family protein [Gammaproteobacteria bacterium]
MNNIQEGHTQHWQVVRDEKSSIGWLTLDKHSASVNTLNREVMDELKRVCEELKTQTLKALIITSAKPSGFIAGADIGEIKAIQNITDAIAAAQEGQNVFNQLENLPFPTIALISGFCVGGGLELALACRYRIAEDHPKTRLGLPEVKLGLLPGWGGLSRLPRLIGAPQALNLMLNGHTISSRAAFKLGLVDAAVPARQFRAAALQFALKPPKPHTLPLVQKLSNTSLIRPLLAKIVRRQVAKRAAPNHYPAPYAILNTWKQQGFSEPGASEEAVQSFGELLTTETSRQLVRVFFLQERLKGFGRALNFNPKQVHVIGAGVMGGDIAAWCALQGMRVTLQDREAQLIAPAIKRAYALFQNKLKTPRLVQEVMDRFIPDLKGEGIRRADVIIEAIYENLPAKQACFKGLDAIARKDALLATNTSSLLLEEIGTVLEEPNRLVGIHFFNPVAKMPLVEIVHHPHTLPESIQKACSFVRMLGKLPLPVKSSPCFLVNRILAPYLLEAATLLAEGVPAVLIDKAAERFGMPMGPILLLDTVGLDVGLAVAEKFNHHFGGITVPPELRNLVAQGTLGVKTGQGFYRYQKGKPIRTKPKSNTVNILDVEERLILKMLNEAVACLEEGIVGDPDLLDAGLIFGTGFAPFHGGPMRYIQKETPAILLEKMSELERRYGERFKAHEGWSRLSP